MVEAGAPAVTAVPASPRNARRLLPPARTLLGVLLAAMAAGQLSDMEGFARILTDYRFAPSGLMLPAAWAFALVEGAAGMALLGRRRHGPALAVVVALVWTVLGVQAFARGLAIDNCGCFGVHLGQPLRWWVLLQDAEFLGVALWVLRAPRRRAANWTPLPVCTGGRNTAGGL